MPFGLLWCCYPDYLNDLNAMHEASPMPFGLLWCCYNNSINSTVVPFVRSPMPFGLLWCCYCYKQGLSNPLAMESPMPFGLLWCCYVSADRETEKSVLVTNAFRPVVVLLQRNPSLPVLRRARHQCLSACCGVVTGNKHYSTRKALAVTNAFRPVVVLLQKFPKVTAIQFIAWSPMPFGLLWCCYFRCCSTHPSSQVSGHQCLSACCGVVTKAANAMLTILEEGHQCLSACCGVVTWLHTRELIGITESPMPFGLLWCCYMKLRIHPRFHGPLSPMPFGLLWCCYQNTAQTAYASNSSHQCLSACCGVVTPGHFYARIERVQRTKRMGALFVLFPRHIEEGLMHRNPRKTGRNDRDGTPPILPAFWSGPEFDGPVVRDHTR